MENRERFINQLLDSALIHQQRAEPRTGLEARILERARTAANERENRKRLWKFWVAAGAAATLIVLVVAAQVANQSQRSAVLTSKVSRAVSVPTSKEKLTASTKTTPELGKATAVLGQKHAAHRQSKPSRGFEAKHWPSQFPTPAPLTKEEKLLIEYVRNTPPQVLSEPLLKKEAAIHPLEIESLKISPIEIKPLAPRATRKEFE